MVASTATSRAASVMPNSNARNVLKRRKKPYKTEQQKVVVKKRKLNFQTSYYKTAQPGFTFVPLGTPDLADLCKELSRQRSLPMNIVNAKPKNHYALDPAKVSHHIYRIGYHFRCKVVEDACKTLGYVHYEGEFITTADYTQKQHNSVIAQAFANQGLTYNSDRVKRNEETPDQIRAAIKELFPKIPQHDLDEVVRRAWGDPGCVGNAKDLTLPERAQLAVSSRIRHTYTDYDYLLNAKLYDYHTCRKMVEPYSLKKLFEWRGETDGDDEALEEIVRETIVIDDDDDDDDNAAPLAVKSDDSSDTGYASDSSIEISHRPAAAEDLRAEEAYERDHRFFQRQIPGRMQSQRTDLARQMIQTYRSQEHNARAYAYNQPATYQHPRARPVQRTYGASLSHVAPGRQIVSDSELLHLGRDAQPYAPPPGLYLQHDRPMQSIERDDHTYIPPPPAYPPPRSPPPPPAYPPPQSPTPPPPPTYLPPQSPPARHSQHTAPQAIRPAQQNYHGVDLTQGHPGYAQPLHGFPPHQYDRRQAFPQAQRGGNGIDIASSPRRVYGERLVAQPEVIRVISSGDGRYVQAPVDRSYATVPGAAPYPLRVDAIQQNGRYLPPAPAAPSRAVPQPVHGAPALVQQMPRELAVPQHAHYYPR